jgi:voltage-gated potassium channel
MHHPEFINQNKFVLLLACLITFFLSTALIQDQYFELAISILFAAMMILSLYMIGHRKRLLIIGMAILGGSTTLLFFSATNLPELRALRMIEILLAILFFAVLLSASLYYTIKDHTITFNHLCGAVCTYLFIGLIWSYAYLLIELLIPASFNYVIQFDLLGAKSLEFMYYSFVTLTTLGYGDISPASDIAKTISWMEAITGQLYLTMLIALLIAKYVAHSQSSG